MFSIRYLGFNYWYLCILVGFYWKFYGAGHQKKLDEDEDIGHFPRIGFTRRFLRSALRH